MMLTGDGYQPARFANQPVQTLSFGEGRTQQVKQKKRKDSFIFALIVYLVRRLTMLYCASSTGAVTEYRGRLEVLTLVRKGVNLTILTEARSKSEPRTQKERQFDIGRVVNAPVDVLRYGSSLWRSRRLEGEK